LPLAQHKATSPTRKTLAVICKMKKTIQTIIIFFFFISCKKEEIVISSTNGNEFFVSAVDISSYPEISLSNPTFYDLEQDRKDFFLIFKENGINTIRLKLWVNPSSVHSGFNEVEEFTQSLKDKGFKIWLTVHRWFSTYQQFHNIQMNCNFIHGPI
jgi:arabinogalactan endo-1,4-beta-galactosidase